MPIQAEFSRLPRHWQLQGLTCASASRRDTSPGSART
jgi:hypothetical protein